jgi:hypothetical protein
LERAERTGRGGLRWIEADDDLASLHGDPRFDAMIERIRLATEQPSA